MDILTLLSKANELNRLAEIKCNDIISESAKRIGVVSVIMNKEMAAPEHEKDAISK